MRDPGGEAAGWLRAWGSGWGWVGGSEGGLWERQDRAVVRAAGKAAREWRRVGAGGHHEGSRRGGGGLAQGLGKWLGLGRRERRRFVGEAGQSGSAGCWEGSAGVAASWGWRAS